MYIPVESNHTEYRDIFHRDTIHVSEKEIVYINGDSVIIYKDRIIYRELIRVDSIHLTDTIHVIVPVEKKSIANRFKSLQNGFMYVGIGFCIFYFIKFVWRKKIF